MIRPIVTYDIDSKNNPSVLTSKTRLVTDFKAKEVIDCVQDLNDTLDNLIKVEGNKRGAIGLSATQIGIDLAITAVTLGENRYILINPSLETENGESRLFRIGCFSLYKYRAMVRYNDDVIISYFDPDGKKQELPLKGDRSCVVQHEMDHLEGDLLFANLEHKERDLFVPRESLYKDGKIPLRNHGPVFELRRRLGLNETLSAPIYYSSLFNDYTDYRKTVDRDCEAKKRFLEAIERNVGEGSKILEIGNGISSLAIALNRDGYDVDSLQLDKDMRDLDMRINEANGTDVRYFSNCSDLKDSRYDVVFTYEVLETLDESDLKNALKKIMEHTDRLMFYVPTIGIRSNGLRGNEHLKCSAKWKKTISDLGYRIIDGSYNDGYLICVVAR